MLSSQALRKNKLCKYVNYFILAPKGAKDNFAILKNCNPNGIPIIVIHHIHPIRRFPNAIGIPKNINHIIFTNNEIMPPPY